MESGTKMTAAYNSEILCLSSDHLITRTTPQCTHVLIRNAHYQILHVLYSTFSELWKKTVLRIKFGFYCNADGCSRQVHFISSVENYALKGHVIKNLSLKVGGGCKSECVREKRCVSIIVGPMVCELNEHDHIQHPLDLKPQEGFTYHSTKVRKLLL